MPAGLQPRYWDDDCYRDTNGNVRCPSSAWNDWVRWVVLVVVILAFFLLFVVCSCITARRRRRLGRQPYYGTGWAGGRQPYGQHPQHQYAHNGSAPYYNNQPAPPYSAQAPPNNGYYYGGQQQQGVELQSPQPAHSHMRAGGADSGDVYAPPAGPPPGKGDGVIR